MTGGGTREMVNTTGDAQPGEDGTISPGFRELLIGCGLAIGGNLLISISLNLQKYTHMKTQEEGRGNHYTSSPLWWLGLVLMALGELGNFSAYGFAPASLVAPLGTSTVVANMFIAVIFLKERLRPEDIFGCTFAIVGTFLLVTFSQKSESVLNGEQLTDAATETAFIIYACTEIVLLIVLFVAYYKFRKENVLVLLLITSLLASFTVISAKGLSGMVQLTFRGDMQLQWLIFWIMFVVMVVTAVVQVKYLNLAMKSFDATLVVPTNFVLFTLSAIIAGIVFYSEFWGMTPLDVFMFLFGCVMCFAGVYFITAGRVEVQSQTANLLDDSSDDSLQKPAKKPRLMTDIFPSWLFTSVSKTEVQPRAQPYQHALDASSDQTPIIDKSMSINETESSISSSDLTQLSESGSRLGADGNINKSYGATDENQDVG